VPSHGQTPIRPRPTFTNVLLVSHCDFTGNSALHAYSIAQELHQQAFSPAVAVPQDARSIEDIGDPPFPVVTYRDTRRGRLRFPNGAGIDLIHAMTPREHVRRFTLELAQAHGCGYVVHLEDNETTLVPRRCHPLRAPEFLAGASAITVVTEQLLELKPDHVPGVVTWPGFDEAVLSPRRAPAAVRARLGLGDRHLVVAYTGNIGETNLEDIRALYLAVAQLRKAGYEAVLVRTGWRFVPRSRLPRLDAGLLDLGWVARAHVPDLLAAADILVQPGSRSAFNDYRFPAKLPDFLVSGRPVVLPRTNIGLHLEDSVEAVLLDGGEPQEIFEKVAFLADDPTLRTKIGQRGQAFALRELRWSSSVGRIIELYRRLATPITPEAADDAGGDARARSKNSDRAELERTARPAR
jgi:glycosyltransferase involved in cell wall biosynthesis